MATLTLSLPEEEFAKLERWAAYGDQTVQEMFAQWMGWTKPRSRRGSVPVMFLVPEPELKGWDAEARRLGESIEDWIRRMGNFVVATGLSDGSETPLGRATLSSLMSRCHYCEEDLPGLSTVRRRYCSDICRVQAWRARRRAASRTAG